MSNYSADKHAEKINVRSIIKNLLKITGFKNIIGATLPGPNFELERGILLKRRNVLYCAENDDNVIREVSGEARAIQRVISTNLNYFRGDIHEVIIRAKTQFNFLWLDYCNCLDQITWNNIRLIFENKKLQDNVLICMTLCGHREKDKHVTFYEELCDCAFNPAHTLNDFRHKELPELFAGMFKSYDYKVVIRTPYHYRTNKPGVIPKTGGGSHMNFYAFYLHKIR